MKIPIDSIGLCGFVDFQFKFCEGQPLPFPDLVIRYLNSQVHLKMLGYKSRFY
jgi:hypothetical protein